MPHWLSGRMYCIVLYCIVVKSLSDGARCLCGSGITGSSPHPSQPDRSQPPREMRWACLTGWAVICIVLYCIVLYCIVLYCIVGSGLSDGARCLCGGGITCSYPPIDSLIDVSHLGWWGGPASLAERSYVLYCIVGNGLKVGAWCLCGSGITGSSPPHRQPDRRQPPREMRWACLTGWAVVCIVLYCIVLYCRQWFEWWRTVSVWRRHHWLLSPP